MKIDYVKAILQYIEESSGLNDKLDYTAWNDTLSKLDNLVKALEPYDVPDKNGNYKLLDQKGKEQLDKLFKEAIEATDEFLNGPRKKEEINLNIKNNAPLNIDGIVVKNKFEDSLIEEDDNSSEGSVVHDDEKSEEEINTNVIPNNNNIFQKDEEALDDDVDHEDKISNAMDEEDRVNEEIRKKLIQNVNEEFLSKAYVEFQNAEVGSDKSLKEMMDGFRKNVVNMSGAETKKLGGNLSSRTNLKINLDGKTVNGVFTPNSFLDLDKERNDLINDMIKLYPNFKNYFEAMNDNEIMNDFNRVSVDEAFINGQRNPNFLYELYENVDAANEFNQYSDNDEFYYANIELINRIKTYKTHEYVNKISLGLRNGDNIDGRNSAMSGVAHMLGKDALLAKSRPIELVMQENGKTNIVKGTFMDFAKGKDITNLAADDPIRNAKPADFDTPEAKQAAANMQVLDYICGNVDRHLANMFFDFDENGKLRGLQGIDNDASFMRGAIGCKETTQNLVGINLMKVIDEEMAAKVLAFEEPTFKSTLLGYGLKQEEIKDAWERTKQLQDAIKKGNIFKNEKEVNRSAKEINNNITIVPSDKWSEISLKALATNANNIFNKIDDLATSLSRPIEYDPQIKEKADVAKGAYLNKLNNNSLYNRARVAKPVFGTSRRYQNVLQGLSRLDQAQNEEEKNAALDELQGYVDTYKAEKRRDGFLDSKGNIIKDVSGKALARINLVDDIDKHIKATKLLKAQSDEAEKEYKAHAKKVEDYKKFNRLDEYKNYMKCQKDKDGKIIVDSEILNRDKNVSKELLNLTDKIKDTENVIALSDQHEKNVYEYSQTLENLKSQLEVDYHSGKIPFEYYNYRKELLDNENYMPKDEDKFVPSDASLGAYKDDFEKELLDLTEDNVIDNNQNIIEEANEEVLDASNDEIK